MSYRGYLIRQTIAGAYFVEKDGCLVCWARDDSHARELIDGLC